MIKNEALEINGIILDSEEEGNLQLPSYSLFLKYKNLENRIIWIDKDIDDTLMQEFKQIYQWNLEDAKNKVPIQERKPIYIFVMSYGGNLDSSLALCNLMLMSKTPIYTIAVSVAMSAGCLIFLCGNKGKRYITPMTTLLLHEGSSSGGQGTYSQQEAYQQNYKKLQEYLKQIILQNSNIDAKTWTKMSKKEWFIYPEDAIKYGLADKIIQNIEDIIPINIIGE